MVLRMMMMMVKVFVQNKTKNKKITTTKTKAMCAWVELAGWLVSFGLLIYSFI